MPKYIKADELSRAKFHPLPYTHIIPADIKDAEAYERGWNDAIDAIIDAQPTAAVVEVVRCKECKHYWKNWKDGEPSWGDGVAVCLASPKDDAFCSEGERRDDGEIH